MKKIMDKLLALPSCALLTTGRTGTDFLQSLLDSHPQILTFNGYLFFHTFWNNSVCVASGKFELSDFIDEFIGKHIEKLKSRYDIVERKDRLGDNYDQSINIDSNQFKSVVIDLIRGYELNSRNLMVAIYAAYSICLGQDIEKKTILFHHIHHFEKLEPYLKDFPDSKIICMTRDPRANFVSGIEHLRKYRPSFDQGLHLYLYIKRILADAAVLKRYNNQYIVIKVEDLGKEGTLKKLSEWLNVSYNECLTKSTWGGLTWHGDMLSAKKNKATGWSGEMLNNKWETRLSFIDKYTLNYLMFFRLSHYGYSCRKISILDSIIMPFLVLLPLSYELRFFSIAYIRDCLRNRHYSKIARNIIFYQKRVFLFMEYYLKVVKKERFAPSFLLSE